MRYFTYAIIHGATTNEYLSIEMGYRFSFDQTKARAFAWKAIDWLCNLIIACTLIVGGYYGVRVFLMESYNVPSLSMEPTLIPGDPLRIEQGRCRVSSTNAFLGIEAKQKELARTSAD